MHPDQIGPYLIEEKIGAGGMGNVYRGVHRESGLVVAVKVLSAALAREDGFVDRFTREIEALRRLSSRHIVELYEDGSTPDGAWYFAMEYVDGETLTSLITRRRKIPWQEVSDYTSQIAAGLKAAHDAGVVHRDIKPSNLMVSTDGTVKLADFGVAHMFATTRLTRTGGVVGTAEYMSPEQARGQRATKRSDLYSLGAVMYAMLTGRAPFTGKTASEILHKQQYSQVEKPRHLVPEIPLLFEELVCTLLEKKTEQRIPDALVLSRKLEQIRARIDFKERQAHLTEEHQRTMQTSGDSTPDEVTAQYHGPGPATIVGDLVRQEAASQLQKTPIGKFFDNIYVLIVLLILIVFLGVYLTQNASLTVEKRLAEAKNTILNRKAGPVWFRAREDLRDLLNERSLSSEKERMEMMIHDVDNYEFCRSLELTIPGKGTRDSEIHRLIRRAFDRFAAGKTVQARAELASILQLVDSSRKDQFLADFVRATIEEWEQDTSILGRQLVLGTVLQEARRSVNTSAGADSAAEVLEAALLLYGDDTTLTDSVQECRQLLAGIRESPSNNDETPSSDEQLDTNDTSTSEPAEKLDSN